MVVDVVGEADAVVLAVELEVELEVAAGGRAVPAGPVAGEAPVVAGAPVGGDHGSVNLIVTGASA